jgi:hypothetical protein
MPIVDGLHAYHRAQQDERDRLVYAVSGRQDDIASLQAKLAGIEAELPDIEAAIIREGGTPVVRPRPTPQPTVETPRIR